MDRALSRKQAERGEAVELQDHQRESLPAAILFEVAWVIAHTKDKYLSAFYHRRARHHGKKKASIALAHKVLDIIYHILRTKKPYRDLGTDYFDQRGRGRIERHRIHRLEQLGYTVTLIPKEAA